MPVDRRPEYFKGAQLRVGIIGCGYVGLPLGLRFAEAGHRVTGFDTDPAKVEKLNRGQTYIQHIPQSKIQQFVQSKHFGATADFSRLAEMDAILICVPTPLDQRREPDLSYVEQTADSIRPHLQRGQLVVLESTTYPGTTEELVLPILEQTGMKCPIAHGPENEQIGTDFFLAFSPEREDPGNKQYGLAQIPKVVGGVNPPSGRAAATKPFGFMPFYPGPGLGGHCIPVDPYYLSWKAREYDFATRFIELAGEVNTAMPYHVVDAIAGALNERQKSLKGARILVLGVAYKKDVDDLRESPTLKIIELLEKRGVTLDYNDPYFPHLHKMRHYDYSAKTSVPLDKRTIGSYDCVVIATDHSSYDYAAIVDAAKLVVDTRNATRRLMRQRDKIVLC